MNRGNLAEDPRGGGASSSRYSRSGADENHLLYVSDREYRHKSRGRKKNNSGRAVRNQDQAGPDYRFLAGPGLRTGAAEEGSRTHESVSDTQHQAIGRLEVGKHGRLFGVVEEKAQKSASLSEERSSGPSADRAGSAMRVKRKQDRPYLMQNNPLLAADAARRGRAAAADMSLSAGVGVPAAGIRQELRSAKTGAEEEGKRPFSWKKAAAAAALGVAAAAYISAGVYFSDHYYPGTSIFGIDASGMTQDQLEEKIRDKMAAYQLTVDGRGGMSGTIRAGEIGLAYQDDGYAGRQLKKQGPAAWPVMMLIRARSQEDRKPDKLYSREKAESTVRALRLFDVSGQTAPQDARIEYSRTKAYVSEEVMGTTLRTEEAVDAVLKAIDRGEERIDLDALGLYRDPEVYSDDDALNQRAEALNQVLGADVTIDMGAQSREVDAEAIAGSLLSLDADGNYYLDQDRIAAYVRQLADETDTYGGDRTFCTSLGTTVELSGGDYGWEMDAESTAAELAAALEAKETVAVVPVWIHTAQSHDASDIGNTYVEVDITNQHMWCYRDGTLVVDTPVVTGNPLKNNATPSGGVWSVDGKYRNAVLKGQGYASPVDYWIPFNGGVGIHDLQSRYYFGGTVYMGAGSHGCVNTPLAAVKLIFEAVQTGTPVVVYEDESEKALSQNSGMQDIGTITAQIESEYGTVDEDSSNSVDGFSVS